LVSAPSSPIHTLPAERPPAGFQLGIPPPCSPHIPLVLSSSARCRRTSTTPWCSRAGLLATAPHRQHRRRRGIPGTPGPPSQARPPPGTPPAPQQDLLLVLPGRRHAG